MMDEQKLIDAVDRKTEPVYMNFEQMKDYYQDKEGQRGWIGAMAQGLSGSTSRSRKESKEYSAARRAIERHEKGQYKSFGKDYRGKLEKLGKQLPPIGKKIPGNTLIITVQASQKEGKGTRSRTFTRTFQRSDAYAFASDPNYRSFFKHNDGYEGYSDELIDLFEEGDYELEVTSVV